MFNEGKDIKGYVWIPDNRYEDYFYLKDFEHLIVMRVNDLWEAIIFEDETCQKVIGREIYKTEKEAKESLERVMEITLKNRKSSN